MAKQDMRGARQLLRFAAASALALNAAGACGSGANHQVVPDGDAGAAGSSASPGPAGADSGGSATAGEAGSAGSAAGGSDAGAAGTPGTGTAGTAGTSAAPLPGCTYPTGSKLSALTEGIPTSGLRLWLRADAGVAFDAQHGVCVWQDQSGNGRDVSQTDPAARPKTGALLGGKPALNVDPGQMLLRADMLGIGATSARSIVAVYALDTAATRFTIYQGDASTNYAYVGLDDNTFSTVGNRYGCYVPSQAYDGNVVTNLTPHVRTFIADTMQPGQPVLSNTHCRTDSGEMTLTYRCCDASGLIGDLSTATTTFVPAGGDATLAEVLFYDVALSPTVLSQLESKLATRYGIALVQ